jgi:hypothetical protein
MTTPLRRENVKLDIVLGRTNAVTKLLRQLKDSLRCRSFVFRELKAPLFAVGFMDQ